MRTRYALLLSAASLLFLSTGARAQTITVCASGCDYDTIQGAIDAAPEGAVVSIGNGTYHESLRVEKGLTLDGASRTGTRIDVSGQPGWGVYTAAHNVTIRDLTITGAAGFYSLKVSGIAGSEPLGAGNGIPSTNVVLKNLEVLYSERTGLDVNGVHGLTIEDVAVKYSHAGNGVTLTDVRNATLRRVRTEGNEWGGLAVYTSGKHFPIGVNFITFVNLDIRESKFYVELDNYADPGNPAPATRLLIQRSEYPYYAYRENTAAFDDRRRGNFGRNTPADCVNVTATGVKPCNPAQGGGALATEAPGLVDIVRVAPNPIRSTATIQFVLPDVGHARLAVYDVLGREVAVLTEGEHAEGEHTAALDATRLPAGPYLVHLVSDYGATVRRITVTR